MPSRWMATPAPTTRCCCSPEARPGSTRRVTAPCGRRSRTPCCTWRARWRSPLWPTAKGPRSSSRSRWWAARAAGVALAAERITLQAAADGEWVTLASGGAVAHAEAAAARAIFQQKTIRLRVDLGLGRAEAVVWTCDLTPEYVRINADYTS